MLASRQRSLEASPAGPVAAHRAQQQPQGTPMDVVRLAHAAADRVLQRVSHPLASTPACLSCAPLRLFKELLFATILSSVACCCASGITLIRADVSSTYLQCQPLRFMKRVGALEREPRGYGIL